MKRSHEKGLERARTVGLFKAMGYTDEEIARPLIGVVNSANEIIPGPYPSGFNPPRM